MQSDTYPLTSVSRDLTRLVSRLEQRILHSQSDPILRNSSFEQSKVGYNVEQARILLQKLERDAGPGKGQDHARDLQTKRASLKRLQDRLHELKGSSGDAHATAVRSGDDEDDGEAILRQYAVPTTTGLATPAAIAPPVTSEATLRSRRAREPATDTATLATGRGGAADAKSKSATMPFAPKTQSTADKPTTTENLLSKHTAEQENLTDSLLSLATALKNSTLSFSESLAASNPLVDQAVGSLDRNVGGMQAAERRMGLLRRMTEGRGWWSRLSLYGWIAVLWVALILIMFVMPKLRF